MEQAHVKQIQQSLWKRMDQFDGLKFVDFLGELPNGEQGYLSSKRGASRC